VCAASVSRTHDTTRNTEHDSPLLRVGRQVVAGYVTQHRQDLTEGNTIYEEISEGDDYIEISPNNTIHTRQYVAAVLNPPPLPPWPSTSS
jgi:ATPase subunit of ABC transporter with duplicated ATPase domains